MAKSTKTNKYQNIANSQVRQALINAGQDPDGYMQLKNEYAQWSEVQDLQGEYDKWLAKQNKKAAKGSKSTKGKTETKEETGSNRFMTAQERQQYAQLTKAPAPKSSMAAETSYANTYGKARQERAEKEAQEKKAQKEIPSLKTMNRTISGKNLEDYAKSDIAKSLGVLNGAKTQNQTITPYDESKINKELTATAKAAQDEANRLKAQRKQTAYDALTANAAKAVYDVVNGPVYLAGKLTGQNWDLLPESAREEVAQAREQHPIASTAGTMLGMIGAAYGAGGGMAGRALTPGTANAGEAFTAGYGDALLNGATKGRAIANGLVTGGTQLGKNVLRDMPIDIATDIVPTLANDIAEGKSKKDIVKNTLANTAINAGFNSLSDLIPAIKAANATKRTVKGVDEIDELINNVTRQQEEAVRTIEELQKQIPEIPEIPEVELPKSEEQALYDEILGLNDEMANMWAPAAKNVDVTGPRPIAQNQGVSPMIENAAEELSKQMDNAAKTQRTKLDLPDEVTEKMSSDLLEIRDAAELMRNSAEATGNATAIEKANKLIKTIDEYENALFYAEDLKEVNKAKKATDAARQALNREIKKTNPNYKPELTGTKVGNAEYRRTSQQLAEKEAQELADSFIASENYLNAPKGANPMQFFAEGKTPKEDWKISKARTNAFERLGWGKDMPEEDYAYRVFHENEQQALAAERYADSQNIANDLLNKDYGDFDEADIKAIYNEMLDLESKGDPQSLRLVNRLGRKTAAVERGSGRILQATQEYLRDTFSGALKDANKVIDEVMEPWKTQNVKKAEGNSRIAKALADMGNKWKSGKNAPILSHDQIKKGVIAELEREVGSVETHFNDNDIEFLTMLAEDKSIPVWQITSEIEHKLNTGNWYTLDESIPIPRPTNSKLQSALNSLVTDQVRKEAEKPSLKEITEQVRNTLAKESADFEGQFSDNDIEYLANLIDQGAPKEELAEALNFKMANGTFGISDKTLEEVNDIFKRISRYDHNSKQFVEGQLEAYKLLANDINPKATPMEKFETWRYLAMLGNPKTMIRNKVGNETFGLVTGISNNLAALGEAGVNKAIKAAGGNGIQRTKAVLNPVTDSNLIKLAAEDADASRYRQIVGSKYEKMDKNAIKQSKSVFKSKLLQLYEKATDAGISDYKNVKRKYSTSLAGYLKANGYDESIFEAENKLARLKEIGDSKLLSASDKAEMQKLTQDIEALEKGRDFALKQAEYATFHEDNEVAKLLSKWSRDARKSKNLAAKAMGTIIEGVVPFKKTPANVLRSGLEYSPLGAIDSIKKTGKLIYENTGKRAGNLADTYVKKNGEEVAKTLASDVIDSWAKTLTGTGLTALGYYLYNKNILNSNTGDTKYQDQLEGIQNYSITINGHTFTVDWAAPAVMPLLLGAEAAKLNQAEGKESSEWYDHLDEYMNAANRLADPLVETSMLSGVKDTLETAANAAKYEENLNIPTLLLYNTLTGYATQGIPTVSGQIARTIDNTRRSTYTDKEGVAGTLEKQGRKILNKIPGLSTLNEPYIDTYGREQANNPTDNPLLNLAYQALSPGYIAKINTTDADKVTRDVYNNSSDLDANVLAKWKASLKMNGERVSPEDYTKFSRVYGQTQYDIRSELAKNKWFNEQDNDTRTDIMNDLNTLSENVGKAAIDPDFKTTSKPYTAYKEGGIPGLMEYYNDQQIKSVAKESGLSSSSNASKAIQEDLRNGNTEAAPQKIDAATTLQDLGLTKPGPAYTYYHAQEVIPGLTADRFASTFKNIDSDSNQGIKQDEIIDYCNRNHLSYEDGLKIWQAYGSSKWSTLPQLDENGTWKKSRSK